VAFDDGVGVVLRDRPSRQEGASQVLATLPEGAIVQLIADAPLCQEEYLWWGVRLPDGQEGFLPEGAATYFLEPFELGVFIYRPSPADPAQIEQLWINSRAAVERRQSIPLPSRSGTVAELWQASELAVAEGRLADTRANCPQLLSEPLSTAPSLSTLTLSSPPPQFYPSPDGQKFLLIYDFFLDIPACDGRPDRTFGTSQVFMRAGGADNLLFPFSQHNDPPPSQFCQPQVRANPVLGLARPDIISYVEEVAWSQNSDYLALSVRYWRNNASFPCAFYQVFLLNLPRNLILPVGEGRRLGWGQGGERLRFFRHEREDPNAAGTEKLISLLADGTDPLEIFLPGGATYLPDALDLMPSRLPWTENGDKVLACNGRVYTCGEALSLRIVDSGFDHLPFIAPTAAQLGSNLAGVYYMAGDGALLWHNTEGALFWQALRGNEAGIWRNVAEGAGPVAKVWPLPAGVGAVLQGGDGRWWYWEGGTGALVPIVLD
jgi:hypothetical protein